MWAEGGTGMNTGKTRSVDKKLGMVKGRSPPPSCPLTSLSLPEVGGDERRPRWWGTDWFCRRGQAGESPF
ncbi:hypothetical protein AKJ57_00930 [candidate division MSBL1 archaeon SCGC-AAA259A05]|uniref:Uncharacterized protein n=1 Tax=candidate division MSBL1 archaeon SCGC-AAA259A05 TaxID=1698259 RepID=A0A133UBB7_9EURY|nr:hypothetical protein AKJ57_00930 [candidate division MSBL1 archaeon SCGC-AAA259A05]